MNKSIALFVVITIASTISAVAQTKSVTNADLEKFREKRLQAEREYRENYAKWGFPSPEELDRMRDESRAANEKLAARLANERIEQEKAEALARQADALESIEPVMPYPQNDGYFTSGGGSYFYSGGRWFRRPSFHIRFPSGYFAGGHFWPTPGATPRIQPHARPEARWLRP